MVTVPGGGVTRYFSGWSVLGERNHPRLVCNAGAYGLPQSASIAMALPLGSSWYMALYQRASFVLL